MFQDYEAAIESNKRLIYTYQQDKINISVMEIRLLSCMGRVYNDMQQLEEARFHLEKSYHRVPSAAGRTDDHNLDQSILQLCSF